MVNTGPRSQTFTAPPNNHVFISLNHAFFVDPIIGTWWQVSVTTPCSSLRYISPDRSLVCHLCFGFVLHLSCRMYDHPLPTTRSSLYYGKYPVRENASGSACHRGCSSHHRSAMMCFTPSVPPTCLPTHSVCSQIRCSVDSMQVCTASTGLEPTCWEMSQHKSFHLQ